MFATFFGGAVSCAYCHDHHQISRTKIGVREFLWKSKGFRPWPVYLWFKCIKVQFHVDNAKALTYKSAYE